jgi:hypothetical protein
MDNPISFPTKNVTEVLLADGWHRVWWHDATGSSFHTYRNDPWHEEAPDVRMAQFIENGDNFFGEFTCRFDQILATRADHSAKPVETSIEFATA